MKNQRYVLVDGRSTDYLSLCGNLTNGSYSPDLSTFIEAWSGELSYTKVSELLSQVVGSEVLSPSGVQSYLARKAESISLDWVLKGTTDLTAIPVLSEVALYEAESPEVMLMMDDVGSKHKNRIKR